MIIASRDCVVGEMRGSRGGGWELGGRVIQSKVWRSLKGQALMAALVATFVAGNVAALPATPITTAAGSRDGGGGGGGGGGEFDFF